MRDIEELIGQIENENVDTTVAEREYKIIESNPNFVDVNVEGDKIIFTTQPITIHNPNDTTQSVNLGRLKIYIYENGDYRVGRDETSERSGGIGDRDIHPHVSDRRICQGNAHDMSHIAQERNLAMLATFIYEFLHNYNPRSPFWRPMFTRPCVTCEHQDTDRCLFCVCSSCRNRQGDYCPGCPNRGMTSTRNAESYIQRRVNEQRNGLDEDIFIALAIDIIGFINQKVEELNNV
jgi:hypothetical protein